MGTAINVLAANNIVGPGGDLYKVNALAQLGGDPAALYDAMAGRISPGLESMGVTQQDAKSMFQDSMTRNLRARFIDQGGTATTPATKAMQRLITKYGGDVGAYMMGEQAAGGDQNKLLTDLGAGLNAVMPQTISTTEQGKAVAAMLAGAGDTGNVYGKGLGDAAYNSTAREYERSKQKGSEKDFRSFLESNGDFVKQLSQDMMEFGKTFLRMGNIDVGAEAASKSLIALADAADGLTHKLGGVTPERAKQDLTQERLKLQQRQEQGKATPNKNALDRMKRIYDKNPKSLSAASVKQLRDNGYIQ
jgi:hypothetical protein